MNQGGDYLILSHHCFCARAFCNGVLYSCCLFGLGPRLPTAPTTTASATVQNNPVLFPLQDTAILESGWTEYCRRQSTMQLLSLFRAHIVGFPSPAKSIAVDGMNIASANPQCSFYVPIGIPRTPEMDLERSRIFRSALAFDKLKKVLG